MAEDSIPTVSGRMGKASEHLVAASCIILSRGELNVSTALVDDEGVDLVFHRRHGTKTLAVQVKARMSDAKSVKAGHFIADLRTATFKARPDFYLLFVLVNVATGSFGPVWLIPSLEFKDRKENARGKLRFRGSLGARSQDQWSDFKVSETTQLTVKLLDLLAE